MSNSTDLRYSSNDHEYQEFANANLLLQKVLASDEQDSKKGNAGAPHVGSSEVNESNKSDTFTETTARKRYDGPWRYQVYYPGCVQCHKQLKASDSRLKTRR